MVWMHLVIRRMAARIMNVGVNQRSKQMDSDVNLENEKTTEQNPPDETVPTSKVPRVAIFTIEDEPDEREWTSIDLGTGYDNPTLDAAQPDENSHVIRDPLPRLEHYRTSQKTIRRPSLGELHGDLDEQCKEAIDKTEQPAATGGHGTRLGWIQGVLIPCLLNIWGVMLFLRLSWIVALAGVLETLLIIGLSYAVCVITALSLSAISTNGQVQGGGIYYLISRSLGPEFGGAVGIVLAFANAVAASMNTIGFCSSLNQLLASFGLKIVDGELTDVRIVGTFVIVVLVVICAVGMDWETKIQNFLLLAIGAAIGSFVVGVVIGPRTDEQRARGFAGLSGRLLAANLGPDYRDNEGFFTVFGIFFPSVTGVQAGANICGELRDPAMAIPRGTFLALLISGASYVLFVLLAGSASHRDASGSVADLINGTSIVDCRRVALATGVPCRYGLHNDYAAMQLMALSGALIYAGCFAATFSTTLTNLASVPRIIRALGLDRLYPGLTFFAKGYGGRHTPYRAHALVLCLSTLFVLLANLNLIAPLITTFYLASYALINFCAFHAATVKPVGWRPTFRYHHQWVSLLGTVLCVVIAFCIDLIASGITMVLIAALHLTVIYRKPDVNWGSTTQAQTYKSALSATLRLQGVGDHVKNYHPSVLVLAGDPASRPPLIDLAHQITKDQALLIVGDVVAGGRLSHRKREQRASAGRRYLQERHVRGFYQLIDGIGFAEGARALMQTSGVGKLATNIVLLGFKADWMRCPLRELQTYYNVLNDVFDNRMALAILRLPNGLDVGSSSSASDAPPDDSRAMSANESMASLQDFSVPQKLVLVDSNLEIRRQSHGKRSYSLQWAEGNSSVSVRTSRESLGSEWAETVGIRGNLFRCKQPKGTIDVWWLYDDGGLTMLIPHVLSLRAKWALCKVRVFALATNQQRTVEAEEKNMANLLAKLRIEYSSLVMLSDVTKAPRPETQAMHRQLLRSFETFPAQLTPPELGAAERIELENKTHRQLRLRELLLEHSAEARLIVMSMPMPRLGTVSAPLYMSWLEMLTKDMPPMLLVRGNQTSVLTFYS